MHRELTIERRGELYHLRFHNYMGPWEGHQIEKLLDLEEVPAPPDGTSYEEVLDANQAYLWHAMDFDPDLHALVTEDRLPRVAQIVRDRQVEVLEGKDLLPEPPAERIGVEVGADAEADSYVARIEERHRSSWERGPKAFLGALLLRVVPLVIVVYAVIVIGRHTGDHYEAATLGQIFGRAQAPVAEASTWERWTDPDHSHLMRHEIRRVLYASGPDMILGDGHFLHFEGAQDVMPWLKQVQSTSSPIVLETLAADGRVTVQRVRCGNEVLATDLELERIARLAPSSRQPPQRDDLGGNGAFRRMDRIEAGEDADVASLEGAALCVEGTIESHDGRRVLRTANGAGVMLEITGAGPQLAEFLEVFTDRGEPLRVDLMLREVYPYDTRGSGPQRKDDAIVGVGRVYSASAQNHHVVGRRMAS